MTTIVSLLLLLAFLAAGYIAAKTRVLSDGPVMAGFFSASLYLLMCSMGLRLGQSREVLSSLPLVGSLALAATLCAGAGTVILHTLCTPLYRRLDRLATTHAGEGLSGAPDGLAGKGDGVAGNRDGVLASGPSATRLPGRRMRLFLLNMRKPAFLVLIVVAGTFAGLAIPEIQILKDGTVATWILYALLFIIGIQMGAAGHSVLSWLLHPSLLVLPLVTIIGTLSGSLALLLFPEVTPGRAMALTSGFGWYSLSGVLITDLGDPILGAAAFFSNLLRETAAFIFVPVLRATGRPESGIGLCGATSMDVTLPVIEDTWGARYVPLAVAHGVITSFFVPFLVPLFMSF